MLPLPALENVIVPELSADEDSSTSAEGAQESEEAGTEVLSDWLPALMHSLMLAEVPETVGMEEPDGATTEVSDAQTAMLVDSECAAGPRSPETFMIGPEPRSTRRQLTSMFRSRTESRMVP